MANKQNKNKRTERQKQKITNQPSKTIKNKARKLAKHIKQNPEDNQAKKAV